MTTSAGMSRSLPLIRRTPTVRVERSSSSFKTKPDLPGTEATILSPDEGTTRGGSSSSKGSRELSQVSNRVQNSWRLSQPAVSLMAVANTATLPLPQRPVISRAVPSMLSRMISFFQDRFRNGRVQNV